LFLKQEMNSRIRDEHLADIYCRKKTNLSKLSSKKKERSKRSWQTTNTDGSNEYGHDPLCSDDDSSSSSSSSSSNTSSSDMDKEDEEGREFFRTLNSIRAPKAKGWRILRRHLKKGTLLLHINGDMEKVCRTRKSIRQNICNEFQQGMHFSIRFCLMAIVAYLTLAVAIYSCVLEPTWTVIDSCYFAVVTFTTTGYGDLVVSRTSYAVRSIKAMQYGG
jgi:hypothetical protein